MATARSDCHTYDSPPRWRGGEGALKKGPFFYPLAPSQRGRSIRVAYARTDKQARATWPESQLPVDSAERCKCPVVAGLCLTGCDVQGHGYVHHEQLSGDLQPLMRQDSPPRGGGGVGALGIRTQCEHRCTGNGADQIQQRGPCRRPDPLSHVRLRRAGGAADRCWRLVPNTLRRKHQRRSGDAVCCLRQSRRTIVRSGSVRPRGQRY